jgi:molybdopterin synthase sulfur carrier subunit
MKTISVQYFAVLKDLTGKTEEVISTSAELASELFKEICSRYHLTMPTSQLRVAVNDDFCEWDYPLKEGDKIVFIPPVSGG